MSVVGSQQWVALSDSKIQKRVDKGRSVSRWRVARGWGCQGWPGSGWGDRPAAIGGRGRAGGRRPGPADSFNHTSGPRQFTSFCHQLCWERRTGAEVAAAPPDGASGLEPKCVQRKPGVAGAGSTRRWGYWSRVSAAATAVRRGTLRLAVAAADRH